VKVFVCNHTDKHIAGFRPLVSDRPVGWRQFGDSVNWKIARHLAGLNPAILLLD
jgi:hypothetical protein